MAGRSLDVRRADRASLAPRYLHSDNRWEGYFGLEQRTKMTKQEIASHILSNLWLADFFWFFILKGL